VQMPGPSPLQCFQETRISNLVVKMEGGWPQTLKEYIGEKKVGKSLSR